MEIRSAEFICSNTKVDQLPQPDKPEHAFIGRSNVGKSSLINMLTGKRKLAKTSQTPGKTQLINHFLINDSWYMRSEEQTSELQSLMSISYAFFCLKKKK